MSESKDAFGDRMKTFENVGIPRITPEIAGDNDLILYLRLDGRSLSKFTKKIKVDNIFKNLKEGLYTLAGIEGGNLSGGQKQIILLMRNMFKDNKIVILDEPTSAIDKENTDNVINAIRELGKNKTLYLIYAYGNSDYTSETDLIIF